MGQTVSCRIHCGNVARQELFAAIRDGDTDFVERMIQDKLKLANSASSYECLSPLHVAASHGQLQIISFLLERGAEANVRTQKGQTPLMLACKNGHSDCVELLLRSGANVLAFDCTRLRTCLHLASKAGHTDCVRQILDASKQSSVANSWGFVRFVNARDNYGATPMHLAARAGHATVVSQLLEIGALVSATTATTGNGPGRGSTPIHCAARGGSVDCVRELLAWGADRNQREISGFTPYDVAVKNRNTACAALLNPNSAEPLVWPFPWKFMSELEPAAKTLLEAALEQANDERDGKMSQPTLVTSGSINCKEELAVDSLEEPIQTGGMGVQEVCCICFEQFCTIEVKECGHQMCATCTLSLCCHSKPNPAIPYSPPPSCPFCRRNIGHLILATPKHKLYDTSKERSKHRRSRKSRGSSGSKGSTGANPFIQRLSSSRGSNGRSGRIADSEWLNHRW